MDAGDFSCYINSSLAISIEAVGPLTRAINPMVPEDHGKGSANDLASGKTTIRINAA